jgi:hypothetical protein
VAVDPRSGTVSAWTGAIVGDFIVGSGMLVGPPVFQPAKPKLILKGKKFTTQVIAGDVKRIVVGKPRLSLRGKHYDTYASSTPQFTPNPRLILRGKAIRLVLPTKAPQNKSKLILRGKHYNRVTSYTIQPRKPKIILKGGALGRVGKAGMVPSPARGVILTPSPSADRVLVPTAAYTGDLLVPTVEEFV